VVIVRGKIGEAKVTLAIGERGAVVTGYGIQDFDLYVFHRRAGGVRYQTLYSAAARRLGISYEGKSQAQLECRGEFRHVSSIRSVGKTPEIYQVNEPWIAVIGLDFAMSGLLEFGVDELV